jgi:hypothetical protein
MHIIAFVDATWLAGRVALAVEAVGAAVAVVVVVLVYEMRELFRKCSWKAVVVLLLKTRNIYFNITRIGEMRNLYKISVGKCEGNRPLGY